MIRRLAAAAVIATGLAGAAYAAAPPAAPTPADAGKAVYMAKNCYFCHGTVGQGSMVSGLPLAPRPLPAAAIRAYVRNPRGQMPAFSPEVLTDGEIDLIYAYLASIPAGRPASEIPLLGGTAPAKAR